MASLPGTVNDDEAASVGRGSKGSRRRSDLSVEVAGGAGGPSDAEQESGERRSPGEVITSSMRSDKTVVSAGGAEFPAIERPAAPEMGDGSPQHKVRPPVSPAPLPERTAEHDSACAEALRTAEQAMRLAREGNTHVVLNLDQKFVNDEAAERLAEMVTGETHITELSLHHNGLSHTGVARLMHGLEKNGSLRRLDLRNNHLGCDGAAHICEWLTSNTGLEELNLSQCRVSDDGAGLIAVSLLTNHTLRVLDLSFGFPNSVSEAGAAVIADALANNSVLQSLALESNVIADAGCEAICRALVNHNHDSALLHLNLLNNALTRRSALTVANMLEKTDHLQRLDIGSNELCDDGAALVMRAANKCPSLTSLDLRLCDIEPSGAEEIAELLAINTSLRRLVLFGNNVGDEGALEFSSAIEVNTTLTELNLSNTSICEGGAARLYYSLKTSNRYITELDLSLNDCSESVVRQVLHVCERNAGNSSKFCSIL